MLRQFVGAVAVAAVVTGPGAAIATPTTFTLGGTYQLMDTGQAVPPLDLSGLLSGRYADGPAVSVPFPATIIGMEVSVTMGAEKLVAQLQSTPGEKRAFGISQGAIAIAEAKRRLMALPAAQRPAPDAVTFVAVADPTRPGHGALAQLGYRTTDTPSDTVYVTREYDGFADLPDRFNVMALVNAAAGIFYVHPYYGELPEDIPARNITTTVNGAGGTVTNVLIPNAHLPMLQPLRDLGFDVNGLESVLRPMVDAGYSRNDVKPIPLAVPTNAEKSVGTQVAPIPVEAPSRHVSTTEPEKRRNVQASDAAHATDADAPSRPRDDENDEGHETRSPATAPQTGPADHDPAEDGTVANDTAAPAADPDDTGADG